MISNVLQIKKLQKGFKDTQVVNLSSLSVQQGEIYGFLGPNGAGKTTTMKMILSLISMVCYFRTFREILTYCPA